MAIGTINVNLRPLKLAFLVSPLDKRALFQAIQINSFLWGGLFNPIIPFYGRTPKSWGDKFFGRPSSKNIVEGYINAFDPDFIVPMGEIKTDGFQFSKEKIINPNEILSGIEEDRSPRYGIGIFEILNYIYKKEFKYIRKEPIQVLIPAINPQYKIFLASIFGFLPKTIDNEVKKDFDKLLNIDRSPITIKDYINNFSIDKIFPRRLMKVKINRLRTHSHNNGNCIFLMDSSNSLDIIDYWNLRACGWNIIPIAKQISNLDITKTITAEFIEENFIPYYQNPKIYHDTTILRSRNIVKSELEEFTSSLNIKNPEEQSNFKYSMQFWYPRIWDNWARDKDNVDPCKLVAKSEEHDLQSIPDHISLKTIDPEFASRFGGHGTYRYANEIDIRLYGNDGEPYAEVIPVGIENISHSIGAIGFREWRISKEGLVYLSSHKNRKMTLSPPLAENIMRFWFESNKWTVEVSSAGLIAKQMLKQLGGGWGIGVIKRQGLIHLLNKMSAGKSFPKAAFWGEIQKITNEEKYKRVLKQNSLTL